MLNTHTSFDISKTKRMWMLSLSVAMFLCMLPLQSWATKATSKGGLELSPKSDVHEINKRLRPRRIALVIGIEKIGRLKGLSKKLRNT